MSTWDDKPNDYEHACKIIERLRAAFLRNIARENECYAWVRDLPIPCDEKKCGCLVEMEAALQPEEEK
jgi:hypothetical protein